ncbi:MAG: flagellar biosynthetic protein FliR [Chlamydiales bacterium]|nr:flagellar biosynthetic protein FliR [Chlamydiales bacterium]
MAPDFIQLLLEMKGMTPNSLLAFYLLIFFRLAPIAAFTPFFGAKIIPTISRAGLAFFLSIVFLPTAIASSTTMLDLNFAFCAYSLKELLIGTALAFFSHIPFFVVESAGSIIDYQRGASQMMSQDPTLKVQASSIGIMYNYLLIVIFFAMDGPLYFLDAISLSFDVLPVDGIVPSIFFRYQNPFWQASLETMHYLFKMSIQMAAPAIVAVLMAETFLGIANRLAPQVQIAFLGMPLKSLLAIIVIWIGWTVILKAFGEQALSYVEQLTIIIKQFPMYGKS